MIKISILGCGWLGLPLATSLLKDNYEVKGSTTSNAKLPLLKNLGIEPFKIVLSEDKIEGDLTHFLCDSEILIIDIPPKIKNNESESFVNKIKNLIPFIEESSVKNLIFVSSTSVYGDFNEIVTEETIVNPETESGKQLVESEIFLKNNNHFSTTIIRFGGLIGENRHPIYFIAGRSNIDNPNAPINLIHQEDCIAIINRIIELNSWNITFNAVAPFHPTKKEYYVQKAIDLGLQTPNFKDDFASNGKTVMSTKIDEILKYSYIHKEL
jgi:nucleoside-diphosphate-sugar epimerase